MYKLGPKAGWIWMYLWQVHVRAGEKRKQSRLMDRSIQCPLPPTDTGSFPLAKFLADTATSSDSLWEWQHTQMHFLSSEWGLLSLLSNQMSEKHIRVEMFAGKS